MDKTTYYQIHELYLIISHYPNFVCHVHHLNDLMAPLLREHKNKGMPKLFLQAWLISFIFVPQESRKNCGSHPFPLTERFRHDVTWELQKNTMLRELWRLPGMGRWQIQRRYEGDMICQQQWKERVAKIDINELTNLSSWFMMIFMINDDNHD